MTDPKYTVESVAREVVADLTDRGARLVVVETTGLVGAALAAVPGVSACLDEVRLVYSHAAKNRLNCDPDVFVTHGSVSPQGAEEMARAAMALTGADVVVAETSIVGPTGGTPEKPVGTGFATVLIQGRHPATQRLYLGGGDDRDGNRSKAAFWTLWALRERISHLPRGPIRNLPRVYALRVSGHGLPFRWDGADPDHPTQLWTVDEAHYLADRAESIGDTVAVRADVVKVR